MTTNSQKLCLKFQWKVKLFLKSVELLEIIVQFNLHLIKLKFITEAGSNGEINKKRSMLHYFQYISKVNE